MLPHIDIMNKVDHKSVTTQNLYIINSASHHYNYVAEIPKTRKLNHLYKVIIVLIFLLLLYKQGNFSAHYLAFRS